MKKIKIFTCFVMAIMICLSINIVNAAELVGVGRVTEDQVHFSNSAGVGVHPVGWYMQYHCQHNMTEKQPYKSVLALFLRPDDETPLYCTEPYVLASDKVDYNIYSGNMSDLITNTQHTKVTFTEEQYEKVKLIAYYGYKYPGHDDDKYYVAAQILIWETVDPDIQIYTTHSFVDLTNSTNLNSNELAAEKAEILALIAEHEKKPEFDPEYDLILGDETRILDKQGILNKYHVVSTDGCDVRIDGNTLVITARRTGNVSFVLSKGNGDGGNVYYQLDDYQNLVGTPDEPSIEKYQEFTVRPGKITIEKVDADNLEFKPQGDAKLEGAEFEIRNEAGEKVGENIVIGSEGKGESGELLLGKYFVKEVKAPLGYNLNPEVFEVNITKDNLYDSIDVTQQVTDKVIRGRVRLIKQNNNPDSTTDNPAAGAKLKLHLDSATDEIENVNTYYTFVQPDGTAEFVDEVWKASHPDSNCTIPYGKYTITEVEGGDGDETHYFMDEIKVIVDEQCREYYYTVKENETSQRLYIQKVDKFDGQPIKLAGAKYKIWDCENNKWLGQTSQYGYSEEWQTNEEGVFISPEVVAPGRYVVYETEAPKGYYLDDEYRIPENEEDLGDPTKGGVEIYINKYAEQADPNLEPDAQTPSEDVYYKVEIANTDKKVKLEIEKKGEVLTDASQESVEVNGEKLSVVTPVYKEQNVGGAKYEIYAKEDIVSPDGSRVYVKANTVVGEPLVTSDKGFVSSEELHPGVYGIREVEAPEGFIKDTSLEEKTYELLAEGDDTVRVTLYSESLKDDRQKGKLNFDKEFEEQIYNTNKEKAKAIFGLYANQDIESYDGNVLIRKDTLMEVITVEQGEKAESTVDMPAGKYYYKELWVSDGYERDEKNHEFVFEHTDTTTPVITIKGESVKNKLKKADLYLIKVSASSFMDAENTNLVDLHINSDKMDEKVKDYMDSIRKLPTIEDVKAKITADGIIALSGAEYGIYLDKDCKEPLKYDETDEEVKIVTDGSGFYEIPDLPLGKYYVKELVAPVYSHEVVEVPYTKSSEAIEVEVTSPVTGSYNIMCRALWDEATQNIFLNKTDIFTGENVADCEFEIREKDTDKLVFRVKTDKNGNGNIPLDLLKEGVTYTYQELEAPDIYKEDGQLYKLNTEKHEFTVEYEVDEDGVHFKNKLEVENYRPTGDVLFQKKDFADSTVIPNCKFELRSLETGKVVAEGKTDKNGEYLFKEIPYGKYTYTELEAPDEYMIDTEPHEIEINSKEKRVEITNQKKPELPDTSDIAVTTFIIMAVVSVLGISYVVLKNKKELNNN